MYRLARTMLYDADESKDVVSDIFARLLRDGDRPQKDRMEGYLMTAVRNRCRDVISHKSMQERVEKHFLQDSMQSQIVSMNDDDRLERLMQFIEAELPPLSQQIFRLRFIREMSYEEVAQITNMEQKDKFDQLEAENQELLALTKQAFVKREVEKESVPADQEWEKFAAEHADELETLEKDEPHTVTITKLMGILPYKVAASIIGILFTAGVAFAAIHIVRMISNPKPQTMQAEQTISAKPTSALPTDTVKTDTTTNTKPIVFDNVALDKMLPQIASYYNKEVDFQNDDARQLRFYFVWKQDETLDVVLHRLNLFESITVELKSDTIVVE